VKSVGNLLAGPLSNIPLPAKPVGQFKLAFEVNAMTDLWIALA